MKQSFYQTKKVKTILTTAILLIILIILILILNYFGFINLSKYRVSFNCPVPKQFCQLKKVTTYQGNPALIFNVPSDTPLFTSIGILDFQQYVIQPYRKGNPKTILQTAILGNDCYTITYTVPFDTIVKKIDLLPISAKSNIATSSANLLDINQDKANLILQIQKKPLDKVTKGQPDFKRCALGNLKQNDFGPFQAIDKLKFSE